jgi:hypothetical protein
MARRCNESRGEFMLKEWKTSRKEHYYRKKGGRVRIEQQKEVNYGYSVCRTSSIPYFRQILNNIHNIDKNAIEKGKKKPTKHIIHLKNGSTIHCYAAGETGWGIMGFTIDLLIADEAAFINEEVWNSITPALAVTKGHIWLLSTPQRKEGYYYKCFTDPTFQSFHQSSEDCPRIDESFLEQKRKEFTKAQYAQMYLGEFVDDFTRIFSEDWISSVCTLPKPEVTSLSLGTNSGRDLYLGVDIAGMGEDESTFEGLQRRGDIIHQFHHETTTKTSTIDTENKIIDLDIKFNFRNVGIDDGGIGIGVLDHLLQHDRLKRKIVGLNNARMFIDKDDRTKKLYKEAMYYNLLGMGERGEIKLFNSDDVKASLRSIQVEENGSISGRYSHIAEGIIRAAWLAKAKELSMKIYSIKV